MQTKNILNRGIVANRTNHHKKYIDISGQKFNKLTVLNYAFTKNWRAYWNCVCDCGRHKIINGNRLKSRTKSCGECKPKKVSKIPKPKLIKDERYWITKWVKRNLLRKSNNIFASRQLLNVEDVVIKAIEAKNKFPYMSFVGNCNKAFYASIDRIDSNQDYSDINNIRIIPLWLNAAKMQLTDEQLKQLMKDYLCLP